VAFETEFDLVYGILQGAREAGQVLTVSEVNAQVEQRLYQSSGQSLLIARQTR